MDQREFDAAMLRLAGTYHGQEPTRQLRAELHRVLSPHPAAAVERAIDAYIETSEYFPRPSQLITLVDKGPVNMAAPCGVCDGSGWIEAPAPDVDASGQKAVSDVEQPWVSKCRVCNGSGGGRG